MRDVDEAIDRIEELLELVKHPDTDDESYINLTVRDKVCKIFESLGDSRAVETMKFLRRL